jgi:hypothetical protein
MSSEMAFTYKSPTGLHLYAVPVSIFLISGADSPESVLTLIRMTKDEKGLAFFKGLLL